MFDVNYHICQLSYLSIITIIIFVNYRIYLLGKGSKKNRKKYGLLPNRGAGGSARVVKKPNCFFEKSIFQRVSRIILGPPKHVLHLVWSAYFISTAVRTALKVARTPQILGGKKAIIEAIIKAKNNRF